VITFAQPYWLLLLLLLPLLIFLYKKAARERHVTLSVSRQAAMKGVKTWVVYARNWLQALRWVALTLMIVAMARPQRLWVEDTVESESLDIMLVMDVSPSMLSRDFQPDRITVAKQMALDFSNRRKNDRLGLVVFAGGAFTQCPLTRDRRILQAFINNLQVGRLKDGSAIGMGIATALQHLKDTETASKMVVLLTDGEQNAGSIHPITAAEMAKALGVKLYTIGLGADGPVESPSYQLPNGDYAFTTRTMQLDTELLENLAQWTGGHFFRAKTANDLSEVYTRIDALEKTKVSTKTVRRVSELFFWLLDAVLCLLILEMLLRWGPLRVITV
jgi:Ca-activated chloride channel homolog